MKKLFLPAVLAIAATGCGTEDGRLPPPDEPQLEDPEKYFGLEPCTCYQFREDVPTLLQPLGIAVESVSDFYTRGTEHHVLRYRLGGQVARTDLVRFEGDDLLVSRVNYGRTDTNDYWDLTPAVPYFRFPLPTVIDEDAPTTASVTGTAQHFLQATADGDPVDFSFRADWSADPVTASTDGGAEQELATSRGIYRNLPFDEAPRWLLPDTGLARVELDINQDGARELWILESIVPLDPAICENEPGSAASSCGTLEPVPVEE